MPEPSMNIIKHTGLYLPFLLPTLQLRIPIPLQEHQSSKNTLSLVYHSCLQTMMLKQASSEPSDISSLALAERLCGNAQEIARILSEKWEDTSGKPTPVKNSTPDT